MSCYCNAREVEAPARAWNCTGRPPTLWTSGLQTVSIVLGFILTFWVRAPNTGKRTDYLIEQRDIGQTAKSSQSNLFRVALSQNKRSQNNKEALPSQTGKRMTCLCNVFPRVKSWTTTSQITRPLTSHWYLGESRDTQQEVLGNLEAWFQHTSFRPRKFDEFSLLQHVKAL